MFDVAYCAAQWIFNVEPGQRSFLLAFEQRDVSNKLSTEEITYFY
jgi:hypothetical protein